MKKFITILLVAFLFTVSATNVFAGDEPSGSLQDCYVTQAIMIIQGMTLPPGTYFLESVGSENLVYGKWETESFRPGMDYTMVIMSCPTEKVEVEVWFQLQGENWRVQVPILSSPYLNPSNQKSFFLVESGEFP